MITLSFFKKLMMFKFGSCLAFHVVKLSNAIFSCGIFQNNKQQQ